MKVYLGIAAKHLNDVLENGIRPRGRKKSCWSKFPSRTDMVYLNKTYPFYYALQADDKEVVVFEIDLNKLNQELLFPDEDFIAQAVKQKHETLGDIHIGIRDRIEDYQQYWKISLDELGNCSYKGTIEPSHIKRYCIAQLSKRPLLSMELLRVSRSLTHNRHRGTRHVFG